MQFFSNNNKLANAVLFTYINLMFITLLFFYILIFITLSHTNTSYKSYHGKIIAHIGRGYKNSIQKYVYRGRDSVGGAVGRNFGTAPQMKIQFVHPSHYIFHKTSSFQFSIHFPHRSSSHLPTSTYSLSGLWGGLWVCRVCRVWGGLWGGYLWGLVFRSISLNLFSFSSSFSLFPKYSILSIFLKIFLFPQLQFLLCPLIFG